MANDKTSDRSTAPALKSIDAGRHRMPNRPSRLYMCKSFSRFCRRRRTVYNRAMTYQPRYTWQPMRLDQNDHSARLDWCGYDNEEYIGRIRKESGHPANEGWRWSGSWPTSRFGRPPMPSTGYTPNAKRAMQLVEEHWLRCHEVMEQR